MQDSENLRWDKKHHYKRHKSAASKNTAIMTTNYNLNMDALRYGKVLTSISSMNRASHIEAPFRAAKLGQLLAVQIIFFYFLMHPCHNWQLLTPIVGNLYKVPDGSQ